MTEEEARERIRWVIEGARSAEDALEAAKLELRETVEKASYRLGVEIDVLQETVQSSRARRLVKYIKRTGPHKGELIDFTPRQYRELTGNIATKAILREGKIPWEWALDQIASEFGYSSDEALKKDVEKMLRTIHRIDDMKWEQSNIDTQERVYRSFIEDLERELLVPKTRREELIMYDRGHTLEELREMCRKKSLVVSGSKKELIARLV